MIDHDKALHMAVAPWCGLAAMCLHVVLPWPIWVLAALGVLAAAVGRECFNKARGGPFDLEDIAYTLAGGIPLVIAVWVAA